MLNTQELIKAADAEELTPADFGWIEMLKGEWQTLADLASADLVLWLPTRDGRFVAIAMCRPATSTTVHVDDVVGLYASGPRASQLREAMDTLRIVDNSNAQWAGLYSVEIQCVPVVHDGHCFAVISAEKNLAAPSRRASDEGWFQDAADALFNMIATGEYPSPDSAGATGHGAPRVTDGPILIDPDGRVQEITPNANSAMKRLGISESLYGRILIEDLTNVLRGEQQIEEALSVVAMGRAPWRADVEARGCTVAIRAIPLTDHGKRLGAVLLTRDISDQRRYEQQLMTKDVTIREIHHRVKNNLQTVSALLRIQERRSNSEDVQDALREAGRRVESIAAVHEALSQNADEIVNFDEVSNHILQMAIKVASAGPEARLEVSGEFGLISADQASALATVLAELVANSVEHGYPGRAGTVWVRAHRDGDELEIRVEDEGEGVGDGNIVQGLGTQIVQVMVSGELGGSIQWRPREGGGTVAIIRMTPDN